MNDACLATKKRDERVESGLLGGRLGIPSFAIMRSKMGHRQRREVKGYRGGAWLTKPVQGKARVKGNEIWGKPVLRKRQHKRKEQGQEETQTARSNLRNGETTRTRAHGNKVRAPSA